MSEWTKTPPAQPGWYWIIDESNFSTATPVEIRIVHINGLREKTTKIEWWNPRQGNWENAYKIQAWQPVDNVPYDKLKASRGGNAESSEYR